MKVFILNNGVVVLLLLAQFSWNNSHYWDFFLLSGEYTDFIAPVRDSIVQITGSVSGVGRRPSWRQDHRSVQRPSGVLRSTTAVMWVYRENTKTHKGLNAFSWRAPCQSATPFHAKRLIRARRIECVNTCEGVRSEMRNSWRDASHLR